jgi:hypothetical protein
MAEDREEDARYEEVPPADRPLRLRAESAEDLAVISALLQDAVGRTGEIAWARERRRLVLMLNRFRWEDRERAARAGRPPERVRAALVIEGVERVRARGLAPEDPETVVALLSVGFRTAEDPEDPAGIVTLAFSGDGDLAVHVEALEVRLEDVTRPWVAPSRRTPAHGD